MDITDLLLRADTYVKWKCAGHDLVRDLVLALRQQQKDEQKLDEPFKAIMTAKPEEEDDVPQQAGHVMPPRDVMETVRTIARCANPLPCSYCERAMKRLEADLFAGAEAAERALRLLQGERDEARMAATQLLNAVGVAKDGLAIVRAEHEADLRRVQVARAALVGRWRATADALVDDVNNGHAPSHESDFARGMLSCADELAALIPPAPAPEPQ